MCKFFLGLFVSVVLGLFSVVVFSGCALSKSGPHSGCTYSKQTRWHKAHSLRDRIYDHNDYRYRYDLHDTVGGSDGNN